MGENAGNSVAAYAAATQSGHHDKECLLAEYSANVDLWKHDDDLRQKRTTTFVALNVLLYAIVSWTIKESETVGAWTTNASAAAALLGLLICFVWYVAHLRNEQYIRFRRIQLIELEAKLGTMETFTNQYSAINDGKTIVFKKSGRSFKAHLRSTEFLQSRVRVTRRDDSLVGHGFDFRGREGWAATQPKTNASSWKANRLIEQGGPAAVLTGRGKPGTEDGSLFFWMAICYICPNL